MYSSNAYQLQRAFAQVRPHPQNCDFWLTCAALRLYRRARNQGWLGRIWSALTGRPRNLLDLKQIEATHTVRGRYYAGTHSVPIRQIRGSEGRWRDFGPNFEPLRLDDKGRWLSVAMARKMNIELPLVELIQAGDMYYVRDGHHRISVACALGQTHIDAEVVRWDMVERLPEQNPAIARGMAHQQTYMHITAPTNA
jgi:hypothetical protein